MIIDIEAGESVSVSLPDFEPIVGCVVSGGRLLCAGDRNGIIRSINPTTTETLWLYETSAPINTMASNSPTSQIAVGRLDGKVDLLDSNNGVRINTLEFSSEDTIEYLKFSPDGSYLAALTRNEGLLMQTSSPDSITRFPAPFTGGNKAIGIDDAGKVTFISIDEDGVRMKGTSDDEEEREIDW
jgi:WD40 repeat protein